MTDSHQTSSQPPSPPSPSPPLSPLSPPPSPPPSIKKISQRMRSARLISVGLRSGLKAAGAALDVALNKKTHKDSYDSFMRTTAASLTQEMGKLKGGVMKAGQLLSIYGEHFLPPHINDILKTLQSQSQAVEFSQMDRRIRKVLGAQRYSQLSFQSTTPIGCASLGQVYHVHIHPAADTSWNVALKVQYPGIAKAIDGDLKMLARLLALSKWIPDHDRFAPLYDEIRSMLHREADYTRECAHMRSYQKLLKDHNTLTLPKVYGAYSTKTLLAMEHMQGLPLDHPQVQQLSQSRRNHLALTLLELLFQEIFLWRTVQTDPHLGNFMVQLREQGFARDRIVLLDFGAIRKFPRTYIHHFKRLARAALHHNTQDIIREGIALTFLDPHDTPDMQELFCNILLKAASPFASHSAEGHPCPPYDWAHNTLVEDLSQLARSAVFSFKLRPPPPEALFLDRKIIGTVTLLKILKAKIYGRDLALKYLDS